MMQALPLRVRVSRLSFALATVATLAGSISSAQTPATESGVAILTGFVMDSIHGAPLVNAKVTVEGTNRSGMTTSEGQYRIDSIPPGLHRVVVTHPMLDTAGLQMRTPEYPFAAGKVHPLDLAIPTGDRLVANMCNAAQRNLGPAAMIGYVKDADSNKPAVGAKVEVVFQVSDIIGRKSTRVRSNNTDSLGTYRICGLPSDMSGKVQVFRNGVSSGEVPVEVTGGFLALRAFSIASTKQVAEVKGDSGKVTKIAKGAARVTGTVVDKAGKPLSGARVMLQGGGATAISQPNGQFVLDSLPSGTQALEIRKLGYAAEDVPVELSANRPATTKVTLGDFVPVLQTMVVEAARDKALAKVGYLERKQMGTGYFFDSDQINHESMSFSDVMRISPGLRISPTGDGRTYVIQDSRNATGGCVNYYVDGTPWQTLQPGDIDSYIRPSEIVAVEVYHGSQTPPQFTPAGQGGCATIVVWTVARVRPDTKSNAKRP